MWLSQQRVWKSMWLAIPTEGVEVNVAIPTEVILNSISTFGEEAFILVFLDKLPTASGMTNPHFPLTKIQRNTQNHSFWELLDPISWAITLNENYATGPISSKASYALNEPYFADIPELGPPIFFVTGRLWKFPKILKTLLSSIYADSDHFCSNSCGEKNPGSIAIMSTHPPLKR